MFRSKRLRQALFSAFSNMVVIVSSLAVGFFLPKYVSIDTYAFYKTYSLYAGYIGFFHFGFINGIYLKYGGYDYDQLPKAEFRGYTRFLALMQFVVQVVLTILLIPYMVRKSSVLSPYLFIIINLLFVNLSTYFNLVNQFTRRFVLDGTIQIIQKFICIAGILILLFIHNDNYLFFLLVLTAANLTCFLLLLYHDRDIVFGSALRVSFHEVKERISHGFFIMISEFMGLIVIGIDSVIVNLFMPQSAFSIYAFAVTVVGVLYNFTGVISKIIFPYLKREKTDELPASFNRLKTGIILFAAFITGSSIIMPYFINLFIPKYDESIQIIKILAVTVLFKGVHDLLFGNYFKALGLEHLFFKTNIIAFSFGVLTDILAYSIFHSMTAIAAASVISFLIWYVVSDTMLKKELHIRSYDGEALIAFFLLLYCFSVSIPTVSAIIVYYGFIVIIAFVWFKKFKKYIALDRRA